MSRRAIGIDVQANRACPYAVIDETNRMIDGGWLSTDGLSESILTLGEEFKDAVFAVDAPRMPLPKPRTWYWRKGEWSRGTASDKGNGRHCEIVIAAHRLANPQWTPVAGAAPLWMRNGFQIFEALEGRAQTFEVFPSASYNMFQEIANVTVEINLSKFWGGPKDMLDAAVAARTAIEFLEGRGQEVGGGDGLGTIVLPRPIPSPIVEVLQWPES